MTRLEYYCQTWLLSDARRLTKTPTSHVYCATCKGQRVILKILTGIGQEDERFGALALQWFDGHGAVRLIRHDDGAHLVEFVDGPALSTLVEQGKDAEATMIIADTLVAIHGQDQRQSVDLPSLRSRFRSLFAMAQAQARAGNIYSVAAALADKLLVDDRDRRVLHGDLHHENILLSGARGWLAIDPKGIRGDRTYDSANVLFNPIGSPKLVTNETRLLDNARILAQRQGLDFQRLLAFIFAHGCLSASWSIEDGQDPELALRVARIAQRHLK